jgi:hypothetical protein
MARSYSTEQMEEILRRAMRREAAGEITHDELLEAAQEVGIDPSAVEEAAHELDAERADAQREARVRRELRLRALAAFGNYLVLNALAFTVDAFTGPEQWFQWVALGSTALFLRRLFVNLLPGERTLEKADKRLQKREQRELKHRDHAAWQRNRKQRQKQTTEQFERALEEGVQAVLKVAGDKLEKYNRASQRPSAPGPRVRVEPGPPAGRGHDQSIDDAELSHEEPRRRPR